MSKSNSHKATHAGGIVFRMKGADAEYLLVGPNKEMPGEWVFPKGQIDEGEEDWEAAVREVAEETGFTGRLLELVGTDEFDLGNENVVAVYYLIQALDEVERIETRRLSWFSLEKALKAITHPQNRKLLANSEVIRQRIFGEGFN